MFSTSLVEPEEGISAWRLRWGWAGKTQKWACSLSVERGPAPFVGLKAVGWGSEEGVGGQRACSYLTIHSRSERWLFLLRGPGTMARSGALGTREQPEDLGLGFWGPQRTRNVSCHQGSTCKESRTAWQGALASWGQPWLPASELVGEKSTI